MEDKKWGISNIYNAITDVQDIISRCDTDYPVIEELINEAYAEASHKRNIEERGVN